MKPAPSISAASALNAAFRAYRGGDPKRAARHCVEVLSVQPDNVDALNLLGGLHMAAGNMAEACDVLSRAAGLAPRNDMIQANLGAALASAGRLAEAETCFIRALECNPGDGATLANLARAQKQRGDLDAAAASFSAALNGDPGNLEFRRELVRVLHGMGREEECLALLDAALAASPSDATLHCDRGLIVSHLARYEEALAAFDRGLACDSDNANARYGRALVNLLLGRFGAGWPDYRARESLRSRIAHDSMAKCGQGYRAVPLPDNLDGRRVLVVGDQGLGDELFFLRFIDRLKARGAAVAYQADSRLVPMLARAQIADPVIAREATCGAHDFRIAVGDLPFLTGHSEDAPLPSSIGLHPLRDRLSEIRERLLAFGSGPYIGVTWRAGSSGAERQLSKDAPPASLAAAVSGMPGSIVVLQRNPAAGEIEAFARAAGRPVLDLSALNADLEAMLALCAVIDVYVAVSNTNVHMREACGRSSLVLVPFPPEFRWMADGNESPWFAGSVLYRQRSDGDWNEAFTALTRDLHNSLRIFKAAG